MKFSEFLKQNNIDNKQDGEALQYVHNQTEELCLEAVKEDGYALNYVHNQTKELCLAAVKEDKDALCYVNRDIFDKEEE
jgi:hypothetical protein